MQPQTTSSEKPLLWGVSFNYLHLVVSALSLFALTPIMLRYLGQAGYGLWAALMSVMGYLALLNLGLATATAKYTAEHNALNQREELNRVASTVFLLFLFLGAIIAVVSFGVAPFVPRLFHVPGDLALAGSLAFGLMGLAVALRLVGGVFGNVIYGYDRVDLLKLFGIAQLVTNGILTVAFLALGLGLIGVALALLSSVLMLVLLYLVYLRGSGYALRIHPKLADLSTFKRIAPYSARSFLLNFTARLLYQTDNIVIGIFLGAAKVAPYAVAYNLVFYMTYVASVIPETIFPRFSRLYALGDVDGLKVLFLRTTKLSAAIGTALCLFLGFYGHSFISLWVGSEQAVERNVLWVFVVMAFLHASISPAGLLLQGIGQNKGFIYAEMINAALNLLLSVILVRVMGVLGVALATLVAHLCTSTWAVSMLACKHTKLPISRYVLEGVALPAALGIPAGAVIWIVARGLSLNNNLFEVALGGLLIGVIYGMIYLGIGTSRKERQTYLGLLKQLGKA